MKLSELEEYFKEYLEIHEDYDYKKNGNIDYKKGESINNLNTLVTTHVKILKKNSGNARYLPYYNRLLQVYKISKI